MSRITMGCLYRLTFPNGKQYIGITSKSLKRRLILHRSHARCGRIGLLQQAIRKYGEFSFKSEVLVMADSWDYLCRLEISAIEAFGTMLPHGYNVTSGGEGILGIAWTDERRQRLSERMKGKSIGNCYALGCHHSDEAKRKISEAGKGRKFSPETRAKIGASKVGNTYNVGRKVSDATREKLSASQKGRVFSEEHRRKLSLAAKARRVRADSCQGAPQ